MNGKKCLGITNHFGLNILRGSDFFGFHKARARCKLGQALSIGFTEVVAFPNFAFHSSFRIGAGQSFAWVSCRQWPRPYFVGRQNTFGFHITVGRPGFSGEGQGQHGFHFFLAPLKLRAVAIWVSQWVWPAKLCTKPLTFFSIP